MRPGSEVSSSRIGSRSWLNTTWLECSDLMEIGDCDRSVVKCSDTIETGDCVRAMAKSCTATRAPLTEAVELRWTGGLTIESGLAGASIVRSTSAESFSSISRGVSCWIVERRVPTAVIVNLLAGLKELIEDRAALDWVLARASRGTFSSSSLRIISTALSSSMTLGCRFEKYFPYSKMLW